MPRFFFNLYNDVFVDDQEGEELPDLAAARVRAEGFARDMAAASVLDHGRIDLRHRIEVVDASRQPLLSVTFGDVVTIKG
jgi:hypothetical protein